MCDFVALTRCCKLESFLYFIVARATPAPDAIQTKTPAQKTTYTNKKPLLMHCVYEGP